MIAAKRKQTKQHSPTIAMNKSGFTLEIRIRGRTDFLHREVCNGLEDAIHIGEKWFRAFRKKNPWFVQDSIGRKILVLLDAEADSSQRL